MRARFVARTGRRQPRACRCRVAVGRYSRVARTIAWSENAAGQEMARDMASRSPAVSVIVPCHNYGRFLPRAVDSALAQSLRDIEMIVLDDGSTDETPEVAEGYASNPRVTILRQPQRGLARTRNRGLALAQGQYVQFLDADDMLAPTKLERQARLLEDDPGLTGAYSAYVCVDEVDRPTGERCESRPLDPGDPVRDLIVSWERDLHIPPVCFLFRRADLEDVRFDDSLPTHEEWDFYLRLILTGRRFLAMPEILASYRRHPGSLSRQPRAMEIGRKRMLQKLAGHSSSVDAHIRARQEHDRAVMLTT
jgi:glycosyltransferase involved in cell wall biosynthesis